MKYDYAMVVGRFQPYQNAHHKLLNHALSLAKQVIVILGSAHSKSTVKNPFTTTQREEMIRACFPQETQERLIFAPVRDYPYKELRWIAEVQNIANELLGDTQDKMVLVGHFKDESSYYLNLFPQWKFEHFEPYIHNEKLLNATDIRNLYLEKDSNAHVANILSLDKWKTIKELVPTPVLDYLQTHYGTAWYDRLAKEHAYIEKYKEDSRFVGMPFAPTFVTTDTVVTALGHILVVRRGQHPGKGDLALPGGFLAGNLTLEENAIKELKEETKIKVSKEELTEAIKGHKVFDYPYRSLRGRTITHAFQIELNPSLTEGLPKVKGGDDAEGAFWMPITDFLKSEEEFFEDHYWIVTALLNLL